MSKKSRIVIIAAVSLFAGLVVFVTITNLIRAPMSARTGSGPVSADLYLEQTGLSAGKYRSASNFGGAMVGGGSGGQGRDGDVSETLNRKMIRSASLDIVVDDVPQLATELESLAGNYGGYIERTELSQAKGNPQRAQIVLRVPAPRLDEARAEIKKMARLVESDKTDAQDVSKQFVDSEARLRNYQAEERQYLEIMRRAAKVEDTLKVAEHLSDVRGRIEQLQGELKYLSQQVEMASLAVTLRVETVAQSSQWRPGHQTQLAFADMKEGLTDFVDAVIYLVLILPVILVWVVSVVLVIILLMRAFFWAKRRFPNLAGPS